MGSWDWLPPLIVAYIMLVTTQWKKRHFVRAVLASLTLPLGGAGALVLFWVVFSLLIGFLTLYWAEIAVLVGLPVCFIGWLATRKRKPLTPPPPSPPPVSIELAKSRAEKTRRPLAMCMFTFVNDLRQHIPGLIQPFSLQSVENSAAPYTITADFITKFHFLIAKGECDVSSAVVWEILESIIERHLQAKSLPLSIPAVYTSADGDTWPGLVVDGVYDMPLHYRVDLVITNEAEAVHLKRKEASKLDGEKPGDLYDDQL